MNDKHPADDDPCTLDPPGTISIVGAGLLGIEAGLYGRFLGYDVQILEMDCVGSEYIRQASKDLPTLPNRFLSTLAQSALQAQRGEAVPPIPPTKFGQWVQQILVPITESDLLRGRIHTGLHVTKISQVPAEDGDADDIPPDFQLLAETADGTFRTFDTEAVILANGGHSDRIQLEFPLPTPYFFQVGTARSDNWEDDLRVGWREITAVYAELVGRAELDLYRPRRL